MKEIPVTFKSEGKILAGMLHFTNKKKRPLIIICHGFTGSKEGQYYMFTQTSRELCRNGYNVLRFDFRGSGDSEGRFEDQTFSNMSKDMKAAMSFVKKFREIDYNKVGLIGHSKGGGVALGFANNNPKIKSIVLWSTVADYKLLWKGYEKEFKNMLKRGYSFYYGFKVPKKLYLENLRFDPLKIIKTIKVPILLIHGTKDIDVPLIHSKLLLRESRGPNSLIAIKNADHLFTEPKDREKVIKETIKWFKRYL